MKCFGDNKSTVFMKKCKCGKWFETAPYKIKRTAGKYCSQKCTYKYRIRPKGLKYTKHKENPTSFKKGFTPWNDGKGVPFYDKSIGYWKISVHGKSIKYHRYVMEQSLRRKLGGKEVVHHMDMDIGNNDITNLMLFENNGEHLRYHGEIRRNLR